MSRTRRPRGRRGKLGSRIDGGKSKWSVAVKRCKSTIDLERRHRRHSGDISQKRKKASCRVGSSPPTARPKLKAQQRGTVQSKATTAAVKSKNVRCHSGNCADIKSRESRSVGAGRKSRVGSRHCYPTLMTLRFSGATRRSTTQHGPKRPTRLTTCLRDRLDRTNLRIRLQGPRTLP